MAEIDPATELLIERLLSGWTDKIWTRLDKRDEEVFARLSALELSKATKDGEHSVNIRNLTLAMGMAAALGSGLITVFLFIMRKFLHI